MENWKLLTLIMHDTEALLYTKNISGSIYPSMLQISIDLMKNEFFEI